MKLNETKLWTALITPMHPDGSIHFEDLERLARMQERSGNGILLAGSTGEGLALRTEEKKSLVKYVMGLELRVPVMAGVGGFDLEAQKEWIAFCDNLGVDALLLVTPLYAKPGPVGQTEWFMALMDHAKAPCMIYNIPSRTGTELPVNTLQTISMHPNFWSVKEASGDMMVVSSYKEACPEIPIYSGDDALMPDFAKAGSRGLVSVASNIWPAITRQYTEMCLSRQTEALYPVWQDITRLLFSAPNPVPVKKLLKEKGIIQSAALRLPLTENEMDSVDDLFRADADIRTWFENINNRYELGNYTEST